MSETKEPLSEMSERRDTTAPVKKHDTNLRYLKIVKDPETGKHIYTIVDSLLVPAKLSYKVTKYSTIFQNPVKIGGGAYGTIVKYTSNDNKREVALKVTTDKREADAIFNMTTNQIYCDNLLPAIILGENEVVDPEKKESTKMYYYIAMHMYDGDAYSIRDEIWKLSLSKKIDVLESIIETIICLYKNNLCYTDIKLENILYRRQKNGSLVFVLSDLGGMNVCSEDTSAIVTYKPWYQQVDDTKDYFTATSDTVIWGCICLILSILTVSDTYDKILETMLFGYEHDRFDKNHMINEFVDVLKVFVEQVDDSKKRKQIVYRNIGNFLYNSFIYLIDRNYTFDMDIWYRHFKNYAHSSKEITPTG